MSRERKYNEYIPFDIKKQPRNRWGLLEDLNVGSSSLFGSNSAAQSVGGEFESLRDFVGATPTEDGIRGAVPAPLAGEQTHFLQGSKSWTRIPAFEWMSEYPTSGGLEKSGLQVNGDLRVTNTLSTMNLNVEGAAHFWSLIIDQVRANGGQLIVSPSMFHIDYLGSMYTYPVFTADSPLYNLLVARPDIYNTASACGIVKVKTRRVYQRNDDGSKSTTNECEIGDMLRCRSWNLDGSGIKYSDVRNKDYWTFVVSTGYEDFTTEEGNTYSCFYCDLAYAFLDEDGHNIPIGSTLNTDGTYTLPSDYTEITDALELKKVSKKTLEGDDNVEEEFFDPYEFREITNTVIKVRGIDDVISRISGEELSNEMDNNSLPRNSAMINNIANGNDSSSTSNDELSENDVAQLIVNGQYSDNDDSSNTQLNRQNSLRLSEETLDNGSFTPAKYSITMSKVKAHNLCLEEKTTTDRPLVLSSESVVATIDGESVTFSKGDTIPSGATLEGDAFVVDTSEEVDFKQHDPELSDPTSQDETTPDSENLDQIENGTFSTTSGFKRSETGRMNKYTELSSWLFGYGVFDAGEGDDLACLGHLYDQSRQNAIVLSSTTPIDPDLVAPAIAQYNNIDMFGESISFYRLTSIAANGNEFIGSFLVNNDGKYIDVNEKINLYIQDITNGLESCGIHLDGENSTISMVGNVNLYQHSDTEYDTLNVYDKYKNKRVEIRPYAIPSRTTTEEGVTISTLSIPYTYKEFIAPKDYVSKSHWRDWDWWWYTDMYEYYLKNYIIKMSVSKDLGQYSANNKLFLSKLKISFDTSPYLANAYLASETNLSLTSCIIYLKKNGSTVKTFDLTNTVTFTTNKGHADISINNTFVGGVGGYSLTRGAWTAEFSIGVNVYAHRQLPNVDYANYYFELDTSMIGGFEMTVDRRSVQDQNDMSGSKIIIGSNGLVFWGNSQRRFYAANDGYELKWNDASISLDPTYGLKTNGITQTITSSSTYISSYSTIANASSINTDTTIYLPNVATYGDGRILTVIGNDYVTISTISNQSILVAKIEQPTPYSTPSKESNVFNTPTSIGMTTVVIAGSDSEGNNLYRREHQPIKRFMSTGTQWIVV